MRLRPLPLVGVLVAASAIATWIGVANLSPRPPSPAPRAAAPSPAPARPVRLEGIVRAPGGQPQPGAVVVAASGARSATATTGPDGRFVVELPAGRWRVHARLGELAAAADAVTLAPGAPAAALELSLGPAAEIRGEVIQAASGRAAAGARAVALLHETGGVVAAAVVDAAGRFSLGGLAAGPVDVRVTAEGASPALASGLTLEAGTRFPLRLALPAAGSAAGVVKDVAGRPLAGVDVRVAPRGEGGLPPEARETRTDFQGAWRIDGLESGPAEIAVRHEGAVAGASQTIRVVPGRVARADLVLAEAGILSGRVLQEGRPPPPGTAVVATPMRPGSGPAQLARAATDALGTYELALPAGEYRVVAARADAPSGDLRASPRFVRVEAGRTSTLDLEAGRGADEQGIEIRVLEPGGAPSAGAAVTLARPGDGAVAFAASADERGRVVIERELGVAGREVVVKARNGGRTGAATLRLPSSGTVPVALAPGAEVQGVVRARGAPVRDITVEAASEPERGGWRTLDVHRFAGERFRLADVPAGPLRISVRTGDGRRGEARLVLAPGEVRSLEIALAR